MWDCPKCATKVDTNFEVCWKCGTSKDGSIDPDFKSADDTSPIRDPRYDPIALPDPSIRAQWSTAHGEPGDELVACYQAGSLPEAKFLADQLVELGIPAVCDTADFQDSLGSWEGNPRVYCRAPDLDRARAWLIEYEARLSSRHDS